MLKVDDIAKKLRGEAGTKVKLTVMRDGEEKTFDLTRETINNVSVYMDYKEDNAIITITRFDSDTGACAKTSQRGLDKGYEKFIIDLRGNGGGYVSAAQEVASLWIDNKLVVDQRSSNGGYNEKTNAKAVVKPSKYKDHRISKRLDCFCFRNCGWRTPRLRSMLQFWRTNLRQRKRSGSRQSQWRRNAPCNGCEMVYAKWQEHQWRRY